MTILDVPSEKTDSTVPATPSRIADLDRACGNLIAGVARAYRAVALPGFAILLFCLGLELYYLYERKQLPGGYEFTGSTIIVPSCNPAGNCSTKTDLVKVFQTADDCMDAIRHWLSYQSVSTVEIRRDAVCRVIGSANPRGTH